MKSQRLILLGYILCSLPLMVNAQEEVYNEILNYVDSAQINMTKGRQYTIAALEKMNRQDIRKGLDFLVLEGKGTYHNSMSFYEYMGLCLLSQSYEDALWAIEEYTGFEGPVRYTDDNLTYQVYYTIQTLTEKLMEEIESGVPEPDARYILQSLLIRNSNNSYTDEYREANAQFVKDYPDSKYIDFASSELPLPLMPAGMFFSVGASYFQPTGTYSDVFQLSGWGGNFYLEFLINQIYFTLMFHSGILTVDQPFTLSDAEGSHTFTSKDMFNYISGGMEVGYDFLKSRKVMLAPSISLQGGVLESLLYTDTNIPEYQFFNTFIYGFSLSSAVKVIELKTPGLLGSYFGLKLKVGTDIPARHRVSNYNGGMGYVELGLVFGGGDL